MALSAKIAKAINEQITEEFASEHIYRAMAYKLESMNLVVFAKWFQIQAAEEREHAEKFAKYLLNQGSEVNLGAIAKPRANWKSCQQICEESLKHEKHITACINKLVNLASKENDHATYSFLLWFVNEQVEEIASISHLLDMVKLTTNAGQVLMLEGRVWRLIEDRQK